MTWIKTVAVSDDEELRRVVEAQRELYALTSPELPLSRRQHEMITTVVSVTNRCHY